MKKRKMAYFCYGVAILCLLYCLGIILTGAAGSRFFFIWILGALIFAGIAIGCQKGIWGRLPGGLKMAFAIVAGLCILWFIIVEGLILSGFRTQKEQGLPWLVVLGAQVKENGPGVALARRLDVAAEYLRNNPDTYCVVSGGQGANEPMSEAEGMYLYLVEKGIEPERIVKEDRSVNTLQNLQFSRRLIPEEITKVGIVTSNFHVYRGRQLARAVGFTEAVGLGATSGVYFLPNNMLREFFGVMKDWIFGGMQLF